MGIRGWNWGVRTTISRCKDYANAYRTPEPDWVLYGLAGLFAVVGGYILVETIDGTPSEYLFFAFVYVGLPLGVVLGGLYLRASELPPSTWWNVVLGYGVGTSFMGLLVLWAGFSSLRSGMSPWSLVDTFVFLGNLGGVFGFVAGINRARAVYNRQLRQELQRKNDRLDEFASLLAHDLRNPLTVARGRLELLEEESPVAETEHVAPIRRAMTRVEELITDILTLAREGEYVEDLDSVELAAVARDSWDTIDSSNGTVDVRTSRTIQADERRLTRVFENLYRNSMEHGGDDVSITVGDVRGGFYLEDDGRGIPEDERDAVFAAGYSTARDGTGFGLSIVSAIVEAHGWAIAATEGSQGGARFEITGVDSTSA